MYRYQDRRHVIIILYTYNVFHLIYAYSIFRHNYKLFFIFLFFKKYNNEHTYINNTLFTKYAYFELYFIDNKFRGTYA